MFGVLLINLKLVTGTTDEARMRLMSDVIMRSLTQVLPIGGNPADCAP